jgi:gliding motility-associated-like protein
MPLTVKNTISYSLIFLLFAFYSNAYGQSLSAFSANNFDFLDRSEAIAVDPAGEFIYVAGTVEIDAVPGLNSGSFFRESINGILPFVAGTDLQGNGSKDAYLVKMDFSGNIIWAISGGGGNEDVFTDIKVGSNGHIYLSGEVRFPAVFKEGNGNTNFAYSTLTTESSAVVMSVTPDGSIEWLTHLSTGDKSIATDIEVNENGIFASGLYTNSSEDDGDNNSFFGRTYNPDGLQGSYIASFDFSGNCNWYKGFTSPAFSFDLANYERLGSDMVLDQSNVYHTFFTKGFSYNCHLSDGTSDTDLLLINENTLFTRAFSLDGFEQWTSADGLPLSADILSGPFIDKTCDNLFVTFTITTGLTNIVGGLLDIVNLPDGNTSTTILNKKSVSNGSNVLVNTIIGDDDADLNYVTSIAIDELNRVVLAGIYNTSLTFSAVAGENLSSQPGGTGWIKTFNANGNHVWVNQIFGNGTDVITDLFMANNQAVYFTGASNSNFINALPLSTLDDFTNGFFGKFSNLVATADDALEIICNNDIEINSNSECGFEDLSLTLPEVLNDCYLESLTSNAPENFPFGTTLVTWTATTRLGQLVTCTQSVTVNNVSLPTTINCPTQKEYFTSETACTVMVDITAPEVTGVCDNSFTLTNNFNSNNNFTHEFALGSSVLEWTLISAEGVPSSCSTTYVVIDNVDPIAICQPSLQVTLNESGEATISIDNIDNGSNDNCTLSERVLDVSFFTCAQLGESTINMSVSDLNGNISTCQTTVFVNEISILTADEMQAIEVCNSTPVVDLNLLASNYSSLVWTGGTGSFGNSVEPNTSYTPSVADLTLNPLILTANLVSESGCTQIQRNVSIFFLLPPTVDAGNAQTVCMGSSIVLNAAINNGFAVQWSAPLGTFTNPNAPLTDYTPGTITVPTTTVDVTVTVSSEGDVCPPVSDVVTITVNKIPTYEVASVFNTCGDEITVQGSLNFGEIEWALPASLVATSATNESIISVITQVYGTSPLNYIVSNNECSAQGSVALNFFELPTNVNAGEDFTVNVSSNVQVEASLPVSGNGFWTGDVSFQDPSSASTTVSNIQLGPNELIWSVINGECPAVSDTLIITLSDIEVPTGFSPNGDNINDLFVIDGANDDNPVKLVVLDRWGYEVYKSDYYKNDWDGRNKNGKELPNDTYYCIIESQLTPKPISGYVVINR